VELKRELCLLLMTAKPPAEESAYTRGCQKQTGHRGNIAEDKTDRSEKRINARAISLRFKSHE